MAARLSQGLAEIPGLSLACPTQANEVFVRIPMEIATATRTEGFDVNEDELDGNSACLVTAWNTTVEEVDRLLAAFTKHFYEASFV